MVHFDIRPSIERKNRKIGKKIQFPILFSLRRFVYPLFSEKLERLGMGEKAVKRFCSFTNKFTKALSS